MNEIKIDFSKNQWITIIGLVLIPTFISIVSLVYSILSYNLSSQSSSINNELLFPRFKLNLVCSYISLNNTLQITPSITNLGKFDDYVYGEMTVSGILLTDLKVEDVPYQRTSDERAPLIFTDRLITEDNPITYPIYINVEKSTHDFNISFRFWCKSSFKPCKFLTPNQMQCQYKFNGSHYIYQQPCIV